MFKLINFSVFLQMFSQFESAAVTGACVMLCDITFPFNDAH